MRALILILQILFKNTETTIADARISVWLLVVSFEFMMARSIFASLCSGGTGMKTVLWESLTPAVRDRSETVVACLRQGYVF